MIFRKWFLQCCCFYVMRLKRPIYLVIFCDRVRFTVYNILMFLYNTRDIHVTGKFRIDIRRRTIVRFLVDVCRIEMKKKKKVYARNKSAQLYVKLYRTSNMQLRTNDTALIGNKSVSKYRN